MKKIIICLAFCFTFNMYAEDLSEVKFKTNKNVLNVTVVSINKENLIYKDSSNKEVSVPMNQVEYVKNINKEDQIFKKTVILTNDDYFTGAILYQDREKMTIDTGSQLITVKNIEVKDLVNTTDFISESKRSKYKALGMSLMFPGAGQLYSYNYTEGAFFGGSFLVATSGAVLFYFKSQKSWRKYKDSSYVNESYYKSYKKQAAISQGLAVLGITVYIWSAIDAYSSFKYKYEVLNIKKKEEIKTSYNFNLDKNYLTASASIHF